MNKRIIFVSLLVVISILVIYFLSLRFKNQNSSGQSGDNAVKNLESFKKEENLKGEKIVDKSFSKESVISRQKQGRISNFILKQDIDKFVSMYYMSPNINIFEKEDNLRLELYNKFNKEKFLKFAFLATLRGDYDEIKKMEEYFSRKFGKNIYSGLEQKVYYIKVNDDVDRVVVNGVDLRENNNSYIYKTYLPYNFNIIVYKHGCVPKIKKIIGYIDDKVINIDFKCFKLNTYECKGENDKDINIGEFKLRTSEICDTDVDEIKYKFLTHDEAKYLGYLDLPVLDENGYKLIAQGFNSYGMPIVILYNKEKKFVNKCFGIYYKLNRNIFNKLVNIQENQYFNAIYWQKQGLPGWWNLDLQKGIWYVGYQQLYDRGKLIMLAKYCYKF